MVETIVKSMTVEELIERMQIETDCKFKRLPFIHYLDGMQLHSIYYCDYFRKITMSKDKSYSSAFKRLCGWTFDDFDVTGLLVLPFIRPHDGKGHDSLGGTLLVPDKYLVGSNVYKVPEIYLSNFSKLFTYEVINKWDDLSKCTREHFSMPLYVSPKRWNNILMRLLNNGKNITCQNFLEEFKIWYSNYFNHETDTSVFMNLTVNSNVLFIFSDPEKYVNVANHQCYFNSLFKEINDMENSAAILFLNKDKNSKLMKKEKSWFIDLEPTLNQIEPQLANFENKYIPNSDIDILFEKCMQLSHDALKEYETFLEEWKEANVKGLDRSELVGRLLADDLSRNKLAATTKGMDRILDKFHKQFVSDIENNKLNS